MNYPHCTGPCHQGDKPCPCPMACEQPSTDELGVFEILGKFIVGVLALIGLGALVGWLA